MKEHLKEVRSDARTYRSFWNQYFSFNLTHVSLCGSSRATADQWNESIPLSLIGKENKKLGGHVLIKWCVVDINTYTSLDYPRNHRLPY